MKALVVYNSHSGKSSIVKQIEYICKRLSEKYKKIERFESSHPKSIIDVVKDNASNYDLLLAAGGDGTINETVNGLMQINSKRPVLAYVPCGTCNDTGKSLGLSKNIKKTMDIILEGCTVSLDVNKINGNYFVYGLAAGNLTGISYNAKYKSKKLFGRLAYYLEATKLIGKDDSVDINIVYDDKIIKGKFFLFLATNSRYLASFKLKYERPIILNHGKLHITLIKKTFWLINVIDFGLFLLFGFKYKHNIINLEAKRISIFSDHTIDFNIDGEKMPEIKRIDVTVLPEQLNVIISKNVRKHFDK